MIHPLPARLHHAAGSLARAHRAHLPRVLRGATAAGAVVEAGPAERGLQRALVVCRRAHGTTGFARSYRRLIERTQGKRTRMLSLRTRVNTVNNFIRDHNACGGSPSKYVANPWMSWMAVAVANSKENWRRRRYSMVNGAMYGERHPKLPCRTQWGKKVLNLPNDSTDVSLCISGR